MLCKSPPPSTCRETRLTEAVDNICQRVLQYSVHAERPGSLRYAKVKCVKQAFSRPRNHRRGGDVCLLHRGPVRPWPPWRTWCIRAWRWSWVCLTSCGTNRLSRWRTWRNRSVQAWFKYQAETWNVISFKMCVCVCDDSVRRCWSSLRRLWRTGTSIIRTRGWRTSCARITSWRHRNKVEDSHQLAVNKQQLRMCVCSPPLRMSEGGVEGRHGEQRRGWQWRQRRRDSKVTWQWRTVRGWEWRIQ